VKLPRALKLIVLAGCSGPLPMPDAGMKDGGMRDAGTADSGTADGGDGPCTLDMPCDAGDGLGVGYCAAITLDDGGTAPYCEAPV
jgi:hypothetical protein